MVVVVVTVVLVVILVVIIVVNLFVIIGRIEFMDQLVCVCVQVVTSGQSRTCGGWCGRNTVAV